MTEPSQPGNPAPRALGDVAARQLANATKTVPQLAAITPRWLPRFLPWVPVEAGIYRLNRVREGSSIEVTCGERGSERTLPETYVDYDPNPREYFLSTVTTVLDIHTRVSDLYSTPHDQITQQLRLTVEIVKERQESELLHNKDYGLLTNADPAQKIKTRNGAPTPDDLDELISRVWKEPAFFLAHPKTIAAFGRECTRRGVPPPTANLFGASFLTWRGLPLVPSDKVPIKGNKSDILLMRVGERKRGVVGLFQPGIPGEVSPSLAVRLMGINQAGAAQYLISLYCSVAILTHDALGILEGVVIDHFHEYA